ncbi:hypothetical protein BpHYR1_027684 [Brachionus plicatilis]|uniref:Uncharacterized protein n=1 Tax=Brachionus plicatilis TaxID=10195 RepID=A0A3M7QUH7_BRAPC|nr:hypothetical protein BpHYR1_027684 [Brachionus plicatilis]
MKHATIITRKNASLNISLDCVTNKSSKKQIFSHILFHWLNYQSYISENLFVKQQEKIIKTLNNGILVTMSLLRLDSIGTQKPFIYKLYYFYYFVFFIINDALLIDEKKSLTEILNIYQQDSKANICNKYIKFCENITLFGELFYIVSVSISIGLPSGCIEWIKSFFLTY